MNDFIGMDGGAPLISVAIPVFNGEKYIRCAIESVLGQTYGPLEVIVVDDGSTDGTLDILAEFGDRIRVLKQANQGSAVARNLAIENARGEFVAFLDADDYWYPDKLSRQMEVVRQTGCKMVFSRFLKWHPAESGVWPDPESLADSQAETAKPNVQTGWTYAELLLDCMVWTSTVLVRREELIRVGGFNPDLRKGQDYDLWLRLSRTLEMACLDDVTALYRIHDESITWAPKARCYEYDIVSAAIDKWGIVGPDGRSPGRAAVKNKLRRAAFNFAYDHWKYGDPEVGYRFLGRLRKEHGLGASGWLLMGQIGMRRLFERYLRRA